MQVLFSEEFGYDLKSQVDKSTRWVSGKPMQFAVAADQLATFNRPPLPSSSPSLHWDPRISAQSPYGPQDPVKAPAVIGNFSHYWTCPWPIVKVETQWDFAQRTRKGSSLPYKPEAQGYNLPLCKLLGPCWGLDPWSRFCHDSNTSHSESTQQRHLAVCWQGERRAVPASDGLFFNLISQFEFKQLSLPFQRGLCCPAKLGRAFLALQDKQLPRPVFIFLDGICSPLCD